MLTIMTACGSAQNEAEVVVREVAESAVVPVATSDSLAVILDLHAAPDGTVWVLNSVPPLLVGFDDAGRIIRGWGVSGGGPTEFREPVSFVRADAPGVGG